MGWSAIHLLVHYGFPAGIPESCVEHIGKPYVGFPSPFNPEISYGEDFQQRFIGC